MSGGLFGGGATYNFWQSGPWVLGATGDLSWADISGHSEVCGAGSPAPHQCGTTLIVAHNSRKPWLHGSSELAPLWDGRLRGR
jgi:hypothetical protein